MNVVIIGAGGHGQVVLDILRLRRGTRVVGFLDADESLAGKSIGGVKVHGPVSLLPSLRRRAIRSAIVAIGDNRARMQYIELAREAGVKLINAIHPRAIVSKSTRLGKNVVVAAGAVLCAEARIDDGVIVNTSAVVEHECQIGACVHICPTAAIAGRVTVGGGAFIGLGARIIQCLTIGRDAVVGAGAVVLRDVPEGATVVGVPARPIKATRKFSD